MSTRSEPRPLVTGSAVAPVIEIRSGTDQSLLVRIDLITREIWVRDETHLEEVSRVFWQFLRTVAAV